MRYIQQYLQRPDTGSAKARVFATTGVNDLPAGQETTVPPREVELTFQLLPGSKVTLRADDVFGPAAQRVHQITTYHDAPDSLLLSAGLTLRAGAANGHFVQTVKSRDNGVTLADSRHEWEWPVSNGAPDLVKLAGAAELASVAEKLADRLEPVIVTDIWRTSRLHSLAGGAAAEASLDIGHVAAGGKAEPICELELELTHGPVAPLYRLAIRLAEMRLCGSARKARPRAAGRCAMATTAVP